VIPPVCVRNVLHPGGVLELFIHPIVSSTPSESGGHVGSLSGGIAGLNPRLLSCLPPGGGEYPYRGSQAFPKLMGRRGSRPYRRSRSDETLIQFHASAFQIEGSLLTAPLLNPGGRSQRVPLSRSGPHARVRMRWELESCSPQRPLLLLP
jgi:hypothetical protein